MHLPSLPTCPSASVPLCVCVHQVRLGEKEALDGLMAFFEGRAADLRALEYYQVGAVTEEGERRGKGDWP